MKKVLHITETYAPIGGVETYLINLLHHLEDYGHENVVVYRKQHARTPLNNRRSIYLVPITDHPKIQREKLKNIIQTENPSVIYLHTLYNPGLVELTSSLAPTVGYIHIFYPVCPGLGKLFRRGDEVCNRAFNLGCASMIYSRRCASAKNPLNIVRILERTRRYLIAYRSLPRIIVGSRYMEGLMIQNGIKSENIEILPPHFVTKNQHTNIHVSGENGSNVLFAGRLEYEKGFPYLLKAFKFVKEPYQLLVAGEGSLKDQYMQITKAQGLENRVKFLGWLPAKQLDAVYAQSSLLVLPSIMPEPFGKVGIEAMYYQKPVVAFDVGGISDWLKDGYNGYLVSPKETGQLAFRINQLLADENLAQKMGIKGRQFVEQHFSSKDHVDRLLNIFESVLTRG